MTISPNDPRVRLFGRTYSLPEHPDSVFFPWTCSGFTVTFRGTSLRADMACDRWDSEQARGYITVVTDGDETDRRVIALDQPGCALYVLAEDLTDGVHTVSVYKQSEALQSNWEVTALILPDGELLETPHDDNRLKIEFIGDSITAGFGNRCPTKDGPFCTKEQDGYESYAALTARALNADYHVMAVSGFGMYRSPFGQDIPPLFPYSDGLQGKRVKWDFARFTPDIVVVNLGTNDGGWINLEPTLSTEEKIRLVKERYVEFLHTLRKTYPGAYLLCTIGLLESNATPYVEQAVATAQADGIERLSFLKLPAATSFGAGHPSLEAHRQGAEALTAALREILE
ncbi:MAG: GDSL-type esterase/lipase family protein [Acutalibacteraceae bacterium]|jgi:lysophospholipase L1-like esterase